MLKEGGLQFRRSLAVRLRIKPISDLNFPCKIESGTEFQASSTNRKNFPYMVMSNWPQYLSTDWREKSIMGAERDPERQSIFSQNKQFSWLYICAEKFTAALCMDTTYRVDLCRVDFRPRDKCVLCYHVTIQCHCYIQICV